MEKTILKTAILLCLILIISSFANAQWKYAEDGNKTESKQSNNSSNRKNSGTLSNEKAIKIIETYLNKNGKVILDFTFSTYEKNILYVSNDYSLNPKSWMGHAYELGLINVSTRLIDNSHIRSEPNYGVLIASLTQKAKQYVISQRSSSGSFGKKTLTAKVLTGDWEVTFINDIFKKGENEYEVNTSEKFNGNVFSKYYFHNGYMNNQGGNPVKNRETRVKSYILRKNTSGEWKVYN